MQWPLASMEMYSSGRRGAPAKGVGRVTGARVQISPSPPSEEPIEIWTFAVRHFNRFFFYSFICKAFGGVESVFEIGHVFPKKWNFESEKIKSLLLNSCNRTSGAIFAVIFSFFGIGCPIIIVRMWALAVVENHIVINSFFEFFIRSILGAIEFFSLKTWEKRLYNGIIVRGISTRKRLDDL